MIWLCLWSVQIIVCFYLEKFSGLTLDRLLALTKMFLSYCKRPSSKLWHFKLTTKLFWLSLEKFKSFLEVLFVFNFLTTLATKESYLINLPKQVILFLKSEFLVYSLYNAIENEMIEPSFSLDIILKLPQR